MRCTLPLLIVAAWAVAPLAHAQTTTPQPADARTGAIARPATQPAAASEPAHATAHPSRHVPVRHGSRSSDGDKAKRGDKAHASAPADKGSSVLALGATDITGNKELPKVMVIVPWKPSTGTDQMVKPSDSLMDEVLGPVDRGMFQRQIRYYGQINARQVAPVGDSH